MLQKRTVQTSVIAILASALVALLSACDRRLYYMVFSPDDLYVPIVLAPFDVANSSSSYTTSFENKYPGFHAIGLIVQKPPPVGEGYKVDFELEVSVLKGDKALLSQHLSQPILPFWSGEIGTSGVGLLTYQVPDDLPEDENLTLVVKVLKSGTEFVNLYGKTQLFVKKFSDE